MAPYSTWKTFLQTVTISLLNENMKIKNADGKHTFSASEACSRRHWQVTCTTSSVTNEKGSLKIKQQEKHMKFPPEDNFLGFLLKIKFTLHTTLQCMKKLGQPHEKIWEDSVDTSRELNVGVRLFSTSFDSVDFFTWFFFSIENKFNLKLFHFLLPLAVSTWKF